MLKYGFSTLALKLLASSLFALEPSRGLTFQQVARSRQAFSPSEDLVCHYQTEALLGLYTPIAEGQGVATCQDQPIPGGT
ncbi:hypothetical protein EVAR_72968_1, partial [Eumeta japonica]